ncbi:hypothetical protein LEP1GSC196_2935 [Leptospira meyeri serovar Semaranga str. Veldrot Semarang 173]|nr:hypothetical protein LEP1GSC196_2935 [Leptospira meyeri serovar Semaranga str. Veldrot Semarang 173]
MLLSEFNISNSPKQFEKRRRAKKNLVQFCIILYRFFEKFIRFVFKPR